MKCTINPLSQLTAVAAKAAVTIVMAAALLSAMPFSLAVAQTTGSGASSTDTTMGPTTSPMGPSGGRQPTGTSAAPGDTGMGDTGMVGEDRMGRDRMKDNAGQAFIEDAIKGNFAEVQLGQLAQQKSSNSQVKSFGTMLEKDHSAANDAAKQAAQTLGVTAPTGPSAMQKQTYDKLAKLSGNDFDKQFAQDMVADHEKDIKKYEQASKHNDAAGAYAQKVLPKLREHLQHAHSLQQSVGR